MKLTTEQILKAKTKGTLDIIEGSPLHVAIRSAMKYYAKQENQSKWISIDKDGYPPDNNEVLIYLVGGDIVQAYLKKGVWKGSLLVTDNMNDGEVNDRTISIVGNYFDYVTHWMPLPTPPEN